MKKTPEETKLNDPERNNSWAILADKGYVGLEEEVRIITPHKGSNLTAEESNYNKKLGADRVLIENFYGRLKLCWGLIRNKFKGSHVNYDTLFEIACGLTNVLLKYSPLRAEDGEYYRALENEIITKNAFQKNDEKEKRKQWRKQRIETMRAKIA